MVCILLRSYTSIITNYMKIQSTFKMFNRKINIFMQNKPQQRNPWNIGYKENQ